MIRVALLLLLAACAKGGDDGATCEAAGARFLELAHHQLENAAKAGHLDAKTRATVDGHVPAMRDAMVRACKEHGWPAETRACFAGAANDTAITTCYETMPPELKARLDRATAGGEPSASEK